MLRFTLALVALAAAAGCGHRQVRDPATPATPSAPFERPSMLAACRRVTTVTVDERFDDREVAAIGLALEAWERDSGRRECFLPGSWLTAKLRFARYNSRQDFETFHHLKGWETIIGLWDANASTIYIVSELGTTTGQLGSLMAHEIGHVLSIDHYHGPLPSVMEPLLPDQTPLLPGGSIPDRDLSAYCAEHGCDK